ncbi:MAG TPA: spore cortex-lytic protein [Firmicutes bacterium]|mgnify:FL=1|nr:spore cortex-lytic protein [Bacillota bacterium]
MSSTTKRMLIVGSTVFALVAVVMVAVVLRGDAQGRAGDANLLARLVAAEADGEPYQGMVAVASVMLNRVESAKFPNTVSGVIFQPGAFESVSNGLIWRRSPSRQAVSAARDALNGYDPSYGCLFFWNPSKPVSGWIWSRTIAVRIGKHVFAR